MERRDFIRAMLAGASSAMLPSAFWRTVVFASSPARPGPSPYGPLAAANGDGLELPAGFTSRVIARSGSAVGTTGHVWHRAPDGGGCVADGEGGWVYTSNAELNGPSGGCSAIRFDADGSIRDAYPILSGTRRNCAGGMTPWGTWLSCEEIHPSGQVYECDPLRPGQGVVRPGLGSFNHEAAAVDPATGIVYLTEDRSDGRLYRFVPDARGDLSSGSLFAAVVGDDGTVTWAPASTSSPDRSSATTRSAGGEGIYVGDGVLYFVTKYDAKVWELDLTTQSVAVVYDCVANPSGSLDAVDAVVVHAPTQRVFIAEDGGNMEVCLIDGSGDDRTVAAFCRIDGHRRSEVTGLAFSPDGTRLYLSSQRGSDGGGITYEVTGPFGTAADPEFVCSLAGSVLSWSDQGVDRYFVRREIDGVDRYLGSVGGLSYVVPSLSGVYTVVAWVAGERRTASCEGPGDPEFVCSLAGSVLSWSDQGVDRYFVRREIDGVDRYLGSVGGLSYVVPSLSGVYTVVAWVAGERRTASCEGPGDPEFVCSLAGSVLSWSDQGVDRYFVRREIDGVDRYLGSVGGLSYVVPSLSGVYTVVAWVAGERRTASCEAQP